MKSLINLLNKNLEKIVFVLFCILTGIVSFFHEPWFDELQAWAISKDTLYNILFVIPHYEGHPPLWHLILKSFSYFDVPFEYGLKIPNLLFMFATVWLLIFKSPFSKVVRLLLPFTYFIFYQYAIISRPYSIFCFALMLCALFYKTKNENPFKFVGALVLLCLSCFYGILIAGGITVAWLIDVLKSMNLKDFLKSKICYSMWILLAFVFILYFVIKPSEGVTFSSYVQNIGLIRWALYSFLVAPIDALFVNVLDYNPNSINNIAFLIYCVIGIFVSISFLKVLTAYKKLSLFLFPFLMFSLFITLVYAFPHHVGLLAIFYIFILWCVLVDKDIVFNNPCIKVVKFILIFTLLVQLSWSYFAVVNEIKLPYCFSKNIANVIKQYDLDKYKISTGWHEDEYYLSKSSKQKVYLRTALNEEQRKILEEKFYKVTEVDFNSQDIPIVVNSYFGKNLFYTFNVLNPEKEYRLREKMSDKDVEKIQKNIKEQGLPDIFIRYKLKPSSVFSEDEIASKNYIAMTQFNGYRVWKNSYAIFNCSLFIRKTLYDEITNTSN